MRRSMPNTTLTPPDQDRPPPAEGIVRDLGDLPPGALLDERALARVFGGCHPITVKRAVARGELPPPVRLFGKPHWTAGVILGHIEARLADAKREAEKDAARLARLRPGGTT